VLASFHWTNPGLLFRVLLKSECRLLGGISSAHGPERWIDGGVRLTCVRPGEEHPLHLPSGLVRRLRKLELTDSNCSRSRGEGVDAGGPRRHVSGGGARFLPPQTSRHQLQLRRLGGAAPRHRDGLRAVPTGSGLQLQEVPPLQYQRSAQLFY